MLQEHSEALQFEPVFERCDDYNALQRALRARASKLPLTRRDLDEASGLANGFCGGALAENFTRRLAAQNLYSLLGALGLALIVVDDSAATARVSKIVNRFPQRHESQCRWGNMAARTGKQAKAAKEASRPKSRAIKKRAA